jgi:hypothetical protein
MESFFAQYVGRRYSHLLVTYIVNALETAGLNPFVGLLHPDRIGCLELALESRQSRWRSRPRGLDLIGLTARCL